MEDFQRKFFYGSVYRECADSPIGDHIRVQHGP